MANQEQLAILKQGVKVWNEWREEHPDEEVDLSEAILRGAKLGGANLRAANLTDADLSEALLNVANLFQANLVRAKLTGARLTGTTLCGADLEDADMSSTSMIGTNLRLNGTTSSQEYVDSGYSTDLSGVKLSKASLLNANFSDAILDYADLSYTSMGGLILLNVDLSTVKGLETVNHVWPSTISIDTIYHSHGIIPIAFLKGAGVPDSFIEYMRSFVSNPIDYYSCFISYSSRDQAFAERLYADLQTKGVRCWFAPHDMKIGDEIRPRIDESIRVHDKLLLVLSESSLGSTWVKKEVETAFEKEAQMKKLVLFPVRLDDAVMQTSQAWAADIRRMRHIGDFTSWRDHDAYQKAFTRLLRDLHLSS